jgi:PEP-CTERM motif
MKSALCAILFATLVASSSQASYAVGQVGLSSGSGPNGSLGAVGVGSASEVIGTNLAAPLLTPLATNSGAIVPLVSSYLDFETGKFTGINALGQATYGPGGNFFILNGTLTDAAGKPAMVTSLTTGPATVTAIGNGQFDLAMTFTGAYLSSAIANEFGVPYFPLSEGRLYSGTVNLIYVVDSSLAGNQLQSGTITFTALPAGTPSVPEPSSVILLVIGGVGLLGYGRHRHRRHAA